MAKIVFSGLVMLWRLAVCPTRTSALSVKATIDGVIRAPSAFSITLGLLPSITATQELVVPRSIPIALAMSVSFAQGPRYRRVSSIWGPRVGMRGRASSGRKARGASPGAAGSGGFLDLDLLGFDARGRREGAFQYPG